MRINGIILSKKKDNRFGFAVEITIMSLRTEVEQNDFFFNFPPLIFKYFPITFHFSHLYAKYFF